MARMMQLQTGMTKKKKRFHPMDVSFKRMQHFITVREGKLMKLISP
jgi:hypothetical protein